MAEIQAVYFYLCDAMDFSTIARPDIIWYLVLPSNPNKDGKHGKLKNIEMILPPLLISHM